MTDIQSTQNQRIKDAIKLRQRREREKQQRFVIDGLREIGHAIAGQFELVEAFVCRELTNNDQSSALLDDLRANQVSIATVSRPVWEKLTFGDRSDGILAVARQQENGIASISHTAESLVVVLESIEKPGNIGAVLRTADAAGATAVILAEPRTDAFNPNTIRASLGAIFRVPIVAASNEAVAAWLHDHEIQALVARIDAAANYTSANMTKPTAIVLGSEADGVSNFWKHFPGIRLPMVGQIDSVNVSNAAAVLMYEAVRQRSED